MIVTVETDSVKDVKQVQYKGSGGQKMTSSPPPPGREVKESQQAKYIEIPKKYNSKARSGLTVTLKPGRNSVPFDLVD